MKEAIKFWIGYFIGISILSIEFGIGIAMSGGSINGLPIAIGIMYAVFIFFTSLFIVIQKIGDFISQVSKHNNGEQKW